MISVNTVTVLGANGTMGCNVSAIFASFGSAKVYMVSRSIEKSEKALEKACQSVKAESIRGRLIPVEYEQLEQCVEESDLIFEACAENFEIKTGIHEKIAQILLNAEEKKQRIVCTGTSGLSVTKLAEIYNVEMQKNVFGMHFFNPPYNMTLCELIPTVYSDTEMLGDVKEYLTKQLKRTAVVVKDAPAFLANRIGFQFINKAMQMAEEYKYNGGIDYIDAILGPFTGRAMAPLVTANFVGLDVHKAIVDNLYHNTKDYANDDYVLPEFCEKMIQQGNLGRKSGAGLYKVVLNDDGSKTHQVYDIEHGNYREVRRYTFSFAETMVEHLRVGDYSAAMDELRINKSTEAEICCRFLLDYVLYSAYVSKEVADNVYAADDAMATGFNWCPPMALMDAFSGKQAFIELCKERIGEEVLKGIISNLEAELPDFSNYDYRKYLRAKH